MTTQCGCEGTVHDLGCPFGDSPGSNVSRQGVGSPERSGWLCPACGRGNAPWKGSCDCQGKAWIFDAPASGNWRLGLGNTSQPTDD